MLRHELGGGQRIITSINSKEQEQLRQQLELQRQDLEQRLLTIDQVAGSILKALARREGFSFIRLGDSELLVLAQELVFPVGRDISAWGPLLAELCCDDSLGQGDKGHRPQTAIVHDQQFKVLIKRGPVGMTEVQRWASILRVSGIQYPDLAARDYVVKALRAANITGIPTVRRPGRTQEHLNLLKGFQTIFLTVLAKLGISLHDLTLTDSAGHHLLYASGWLRRILLPNHYPGLCEEYNLPAGYQPRVLVIGNLAAEFQGFLNRQGVSAIWAIQPVGMHNMESVIDQARKYDFDLVLVSAGTAAKYICTAIAREMGKVAVDTGQLFNTLLFDYQHLDHQNYVIPYMSLM